MFFILICVQLMSLSPISVVYWTSKCLLLCDIRFSTAWSTFILVIHCRNLNKYSGHQYFFGYNRCLIFYSLILYFNEYRFTLTIFPLMLPLQWLCFCLKGKNLSFQVLKLFLDNPLEALIIYNLYTLHLALFWEQEIGTHIFHTDFIKTAVLTAKINDT